MRMKCLQCGVNDAPLHPQFGPLHCDECNKRHHEFKNNNPSLYGTYPEMVPDYIKEDRKKHAVDLVQPRVGGDPNPEFLEHYPEQAKKHYSSEEMRKVKRVII